VLSEQTKELAGLGQKTMLEAAQPLKVSAVRWNVASNIVTAWVITLPAAGMIAAVFYLLSGLVR
jgi:phosphate/sulfate permease